MKITVGKSGNCGTKLETRIIDSLVEMQPHSDLVNGFLVAL